MQKDLKLMIESKNFDRKSLVQYDDRLQPVINIDAVGRMLAYYMRSSIKGCTPLESAIARYAGAYNYKQYWRDVQKNMDLLSDTLFLSKLEQKFNEKNVDLLVNGKPGNFDSYIKASQEQNYNYGLGAYEKLPYFKPKNSDQVIASLQ